MSSSSATFYDREGKVIGYGVYFGTASLLERQVCETMDDAWAVHSHHRGGLEPRWRPDDECRHYRRVEAWVYSQYGGSDHWPVLICDQCRSVVAGHSGYGGEYGYGGGMVDEEYRDWLLAAGGFPKAGPPPEIPDGGAE